MCNNFTILESIIIKSSLSKKALQTKLNKPLQQIAFLKKSNLFLLQSKAPISEAIMLAKKTFITYAQPDILQTRQKYQKRVDNIISSYHLKDIGETTKGLGIKIAIIDDGINLSHADLKGINIALEYDVEQKKLNASPKVKRDTHGTQVAGIIFAQHNTIGIDGIAPLAELISIRQVNNQTSHTILAFTVANLAKADIINCSWNSLVLLEPVYDVIVDISQRGREGKGTAIVVSAGNSSKEILAYSTESSIDEAIVVGATQHYSNYGKYVDFILPSGIKTTKTEGYGIFGGTSATAPIISGILALMMSKNPTLKTTTLVDKLKKVL